MGGGKGAWDSHPVWFVHDKRPSGEEVPAHAGTRPRRPALPYWRGRGRHERACAAPVGRPWPLPTGRRSRLIIRSGVGRARRRGAFAATRPCDDRLRGARVARQFWLLTVATRAMAAFQRQHVARRAAKDAVCLVARCPAAANCGTGVFLLPRAELRQNKALAPWRAVDSCLPDLRPVGLSRSGASILLRSMTRARLRGAAGYILDVTTRTRHRGLPSPLETLFPAAGGCRQRAVEDRAKGLAGTRRGRRWCVGARPATSRQDRGRRAGGLLNATCARHEDGNFFPQLSS
jgi:hypothetical protein